MKHKAAAMFFAVALIIVVLAVACADKAHCKRAFGGRGDDMHVHEVAVGSDVHHIDHCHLGADSPHTHDYERL